MTDYIPETYITEIGLRPEVLGKLNDNYIFKLNSLKAAIADGWVADVLTPEECQHVAERIAAWDAK